MAEGREARRQSADARSRAGVIPRRIARQKQLDYLRQIRGALIGIFVFLAAATAAAFIAGAPPYVIFAAGVFDASMAWMIALAVIEQSGSTTWRLGSEGEDLAGEVLHRMRQSVRAVHGVPLHRGDVDHVAFALGGVFALQTKLTTGKWSRHDLRSGSHLAVAAGEVSEAAEQITRRAFGAKAHHRARPLIVLWGASELEVVESVRGVPVVHGSHLEAWLSEVTHDRLDADTVEAAVGQLSSYLAQLTEEQRDLGRFVEVGAYGMAVDAGVFLSGAAAGLLAVAFVMAALPAPLLALVVSALTPMAAFAASRLKLGGYRTRRFFVGCAAGGAATWLISVGVAVVVVATP